MKKEFKKPDSKTLKETLTPLQYEVTQNEATEPPFLNEFFDHKEEGIYVDVVSGEVLFSSLDKFDSGCGWPSFTKPVESESVHYKDDNSRGRQRIEVRSKAGDSHLGHVFNDGPWPLETRYCINSAALRFVPKNKLKDEGYEDYLKLFKPKVLDSIVLAAGCFWGVQHLFKNLTGVTQTKVGYCGDEAKTAFYEYVKTSKTRHAEAVWVEYDLSVISTENVLRYFFRLHDPTTFERQGNDVGPQYRSAIFYHSPAQKEAAEKVIRELNASGKFLKPIVTEVVEKTPFYDAEDLHQDYLVKNPNGYFCHVLRED